MARDAPVAMGKTTIRSLVRYLCSILAINPDMGDLVWHYQLLKGTRVSRGMISFEAQLDEQDVNALRAYVISERNKLPGSNPDK